MKNDLIHVLLIHDGDLTPPTSAGILKTRDLALCEIVRANGSSETYIRDWETVLEVLQGVAEVTPRPDLVLIDSKYEKDESAPPLRSGRSSASRAEDPRGILYGVVLAAYLSSC